MSRLEYQLCDLPLGYRARESVSRADREPSEHRDLVLRFGIAAFFWLNIMALSSALTTVYFEHLPPLHAVGLADLGYADCALLWFPHSPAGLVWFTQSHAARREPS